MVKVRDAMIGKISSDIEFFQKTCIIGLVIFPSILILSIIALALHDGLSIMSLLAIACIIASVIMSLLVWFHYRTLVRCTAEIVALNDDLVNVVAKHNINLKQLKK